MFLVCFVLGRYWFPLSCYQYCFVFYLHSLWIFNQFNTNTKAHISNGQWYSCTSQLGCIFFFFRHYLVTLYFCCGFLHCHYHKVLLIHLLLLLLSLPLNSDLCVCRSAEVILSTTHWKRYRGKPTFKDDWHGHLSRAGFLILPL